jgi:DNA-binding Xre family transcriptional regulator
VSVKLGYRWHLRRLMADRGMFATTELVPLLAERDVKLSREQVYRLVTGVPERLNLNTLVALCDILDCQVGDLIELVRERRGTRTAQARTPPERLRPCRARVRLDPGDQEG